MKAFISKRAARRRRADRCAMARIRRRPGRLRARVPRSRRAPRNDAKSRISVPHDEASVIDARAPAEVTLSRLLRGRRRKADDPDPPHLGWAPRTPTEAMILRPAEGAASDHRRGRRWLPSTASRATAARRLRRAGHRGDEGDRDLRGATARRPRTVVATWSAAADGTPRGRGRTRAARRSGRGRGAGRAGSGGRRGRGRPAGR